MSNVLPFSALFLYVCVCVFLFFCYVPCCFLTMSPLSGQLGFPSTSCDHDACASALFFVTPFRLLEMLGVRMYIHGFVSVGECPNVSGSGASDLWTSCLHGIESLLHWISFVFDAHETRTAPKNTSAQTHAHTHAHFSQRRQRAN